MTVLFVTNHVPPDRAGAFAALHAREPLELALFGGRSHHATAGLDDPGVPHRHVDQRVIRRLAASGDYAAVVCGTAGRFALPGAYAGARRAQVPFVLWSALWAQPRSAAHLAGAALMARIYPGADAVAVYGEHVAAHARARGARRIHIAPQAVDAGFWGAPVARAGPRDAATTFVWVGRDAPGKGLAVLLDAWERAQLGPGAALVLVGVGEDEIAVPAGAGIRAVGVRAPEAVRNFFATADVLVMPSIPTPTFREPWGLVANEAMHQGLPVIATTAVGAAAGGLVRHERNGVVVRHGDPDALAGALRRLHEDPAVRVRLGVHARRDVAPFTWEAWAGGMQDALRAARKDTDHHV